MPKLIAIASLAIALVGGACGEDNPPSTASDSGIRGVVLIGPTCPVEGVGQDCAPKPYATELRVVDRSGEEQVATANSLQDGRFEVPLPPGRYRIEPLSLDSLPSGTPVEVTVSPHSFATATIRFDSGIR